MMQSLHDIGALARRHGFSEDAVSHMLDALVAGGGMAQFDHPEFGGSGQWMRGGMIMLSDRFNHSLKARVEALCHDLSALAASRSGAVFTGNFQRQGQSDGLNRQRQNFGSHLPPNGPVAAKTADPLASPNSVSFGDWWGADLGRPTSAGSQNGVRYAYFSHARRLAIDLGGKITLYDTLDHRIGGVAQQQSVGGSLIFTSQHGAVDVSRLPVAEQTTTSPLRSQAPLSEMLSGKSKNETTPSNSGGGDIFNHLERLADLHAKGILSAEEFAEKKKDLLSRL